MGPTPRLEQTGPRSSGCARCAGKCRIVPRAVKASARSRTRSPCASEVLLNVMKHVADQCQFVVKADTFFPCSRLACRTHGKHGLEPTSVKLFCIASEMPGEFLRK